MVEHPYCWYCGSELFHANQTSIFHNVNNMYQCMSHNDVIIRFWLDGAGYLAAIYIYDKLTKDNLCAILLFKSTYKPNESGIIIRNRLYKISNETLLSLTFDEILLKREMLKVFS